MPWATLFIFFCLCFIGWGAVRTIAYIQYDRNCGGHLKRAADANTVELARTELETSLKYLEANNMTSGYTSVFYTTPDEDIGFWYTNLNASLGELNAVRAEASPLERSNLLMKLRETLLDKDKINDPTGISIYPHNTGLALWLILASLFCAITGFCWSIRDF